MLRIYTNVYAVQYAQLLVADLQKALLWIGQTRFAPFVMCLNGPYRPRLAAHDDGICNRSTRGVMDALEKITIRNTGRGKKYFFTLQ